jgi:hypothetical protein
MAQLTALGGYRMASTVWRAIFVSALWARNPPRDSTRLLAFFQFGLICEESGPVLRTGSQAQFGCTIMLILAVKVFEPYPLPHADPGKHGISAISTPPARARIRRRIRQSGTSCLP